LHCCKYIPPFAVGSAYALNYTIRLPAGTIGLIFKVIHNWLSLKIIDFQNRPYHSKLLHCCKYIYTLKNDYDYAERLMNNDICSSIPVLCFLISILLFSLTVSARATARVLRNRRSNLNEAYFVATFNNSYQSPRSRSCLASDQYFVALRAVNLDYPF
jgi:hypothetical protein